MRDNLGLLFVLLFLILGAVLVYDDVSNLEGSRTILILGGSVLLSLGLISMRTAFKNWWKWRRVEKEYRKSSASS